MHRLLEFSFLLCVVCTISASSLPRIHNAELAGGEREAPSLNDMVIEFIEQFKAIMPCGIPDLGVPALVPFELDHTAFEFEQKGLLYFDGELNDLLVDDLNNFEIEKVDLKILSMQLDFSFQFASIKTAGKYKAKGKALGFIPFNRGGKFAFNFNGLNLNGTMKVKLNGDKISLSEFKLRPTVISVNSKFEGVFLLPLNTFIFNKIVEGMMPSFLRTNQEQVTAYLEELIKPQVNELLQDYTLQDLMDMVGGNSTLPSGC